MDFIVHLPPSGINMTRFRLLCIVWKICSFFPIKVSYLVVYYGKLYLREMVVLHGVSLSIISNCGTQFTYLFLGFVLVLSFVQPFILKSMGKRGILSKLWKICWDLLCLTSRVIGMNICFRFSLLIIIAIMQVSVYLHVNLFMVRHIYLLYIGFKFVRLVWQVSSWCMRLWKSLYH